MKGKVQPYFISQRRQIQVNGGIHNQKTILHYSGGKSECMVTHLAGMESLSSVLMQTLGTTRNTSILHVTS